MTGSDGRVTRWFGTNTDISKQLNTEQELRSQTEQLEAANSHLRRTSEALRTSDEEREDLISRLRDALSEKIVLLQEVHHRVKNNLAVIAALLRMQSSTMEDGPRQNGYGGKPAKGDVHVADS